ncbi:MAG: nucleotidyltransferase domain-containing protein [Verrucomicrobiota bacterium JB022]|nr:nucleotidyltransferase domain-containing protein [Verrucomicrobiota bacterium JB022]
MTLATTSADLIPTLQSILERRDDLRLAILYGSAVAGRLHAQSDVDVAILGQGPLTVEQRLELMRDLAVAVGREVDLLDLHDSTGVILTEVLTKGTILLKRDTAAYSELIRRMFYYNEDELPNLRMILNERRRRFVNAV